MCIVCFKNRPTTVSVSSMCFANVICNSKYTKHPHITQSHIHHTNQSRSSNPVRLVVRRVGCHTFGTRDLSSLGGVGDGGGGGQHMAKVSKVSNVSRVQCDMVQ